MVQLLQSIKQPLTMPPLNITKASCKPLCPSQKLKIQIQIPTLDNVIKEGFWIGLTNPMGVTCNDAACINQLNWASDGNNFTHLFSSTVRSGCAQLTTQYQNHVIFSVGDSEIKHKTNVYDLLETAQSHR